MKVLAGNRLAGKKPIMKIFVTGGTGFIGRHLVLALLEDGHRPMVLTRSPGHASQMLPAGVELVAGDPSIPGAWMSRVREAEAAVNLAGETIAGRWTPVKKKAIIHSRVDATRNVVEALPGSPFTLVSQSAVGYYGYRGDEILTESAPHGVDFLAGVAVQWEAAAQKAETRGIRTVMLRSGVVLGHGGALEQLLLPFKLYGGGPIGSGRQYLSWIHLADEIDLIRFALIHGNLNGPLNATAPHPVTNAEFARILGEVLHRPAWVHTPAFAVKLALGEFADTILHGQRVVPERALREGFHFRHPELGEALASILGAKDATGA